MDEKCGNLQGGECNEKSRGTLAGTASVEKGLGAAVNNDINASNELATGSSVAKSPVESDGIAKGLLPVVGLGVVVGSVGIFAAGIFKLIKKLKNKNGNLPEIHRRARAKTYGGKGDWPKVSRFPVSDEQVRWSTKFLNYHPDSYTVPGNWAPRWYAIRGNFLSPYIRGDLGTHPQYLSKLNFNTIDGDVDRISYEGKYSVVEGVPLNPCGRTGLRGRGALGWWGPNHVAYLLVFSADWDKHTLTSGGSSSIEQCRNEKPMIKFLVVGSKKIKRGWNAPGDVILPGETVNQTLSRAIVRCNESGLEKKCRGKEYLNTRYLDQLRRNEEEYFQDILNKKGKVIYKGYVDARRNTDNAWIEGVVVAIKEYQDEDGSSSFAKSLGWPSNPNIKWMNLSTEGHRSMDNNFPKELIEDLAS